MADPAPKAFISYSWSSPGHCDLIRSYAERLTGDGVDVVLDQWDLSEGQDKYHFMEKMVTDSSVTHVLVFSDQKYAAKADARKAGVGTESQIMSKEIYDKVDQKKFIPIVCERNPDGEPYLPAFFHPRISIDFSTPEKVNEHWEKLVRAIYGKPLHVKPELGATPSYILVDEPGLALPTIGKFETLKQATLSDKSTVSLHRKDFLNSTFQFIDSTRIIEDPQVEHFDDKVLENIRRLLPLRDQLLDWMLLEGSFAKDSTLEEILAEFLERILERKYRPSDLQRWNESWYDPQGFFVYEVFLYAIAILIHLKRYTVLGSLLDANYLLPESQAHRQGPFVQFDVFYFYSRVFEARNQRLNLRRISLIADELKNRATRSDIKFNGVMQADLVLFVKSALSNSRWYPQTLIYAEHAVRFPLFLRATQKRHFEHLKQIFSVASVDDFRQKMNAGQERLRTGEWFNLGWNGVNFEALCNLDALDTLA